MTETNIRIDFSILPSRYLISLTQGPKINNGHKICITVLDILRNSTPSDQCRATTPRQPLPVAEKNSTSCRSNQPREVPVCGQQKNDLRGFRYEHLKKLRADACWQKKNRRQRYLQSKQATVTFFVAQSIKSSRQFEGLVLFDRQWRNALKAAWSCKARMFWFDGFQTVLLQAPSEKKALRKWISLSEI